MYLRELTQMCQWSRCEKRPVVEVIGEHGALMGKFCRRHGNSLLAENRARQDERARRIAAREYGHVQQN